MEKEKKDEQAKAIDEDMKEMVAKTYQRMMTDGTFEKVISDNFVKMVNDCCENIMRWNGPVKEAMEEKLKSISSGLIDGTDFPTYVKKITFLINETIKDSALSDYKDTAQALRALVGQPNVGYGETVKISDLFREYVSYVDDESFDSCDFQDEEINRDDGQPTAEIDCKLTVNPEGSVTFSRDHDDDGSDVFEISSQDGKLMAKLPKHFGHDDARKFYYAGKFALRLMALVDNRAKVDFDVSEDDERSVEVSVEE